MLRWMRDKTSRNKKVDQMEGSQIVRGGGRPRKIIRETIKKDLEISKFL